MTDPVTWGNLVSRSSRLGRQRWRHENNTSWVGLMESLSYWLKTLTMCWHTSGHDSFTLEIWRKFKLWYRQSSLEDG